MQINKVQQTVVVADDGFTLRLSTVEPATGGCRVMQMDAAVLDNIPAAKPIQGFARPIPVATILRIAKMIEAMDGTADRICIEHGDYRPAPMAGGTIEPPPATCPACRSAGRRARPTAGVEVDR